MRKEDNKTAGKLTVYFEDPFWVGIFEKIDGDQLSVAKVTFGAEPKDYEVYDFVVRHYDHLKFSPSVDVKVKQDSINPKRRQREARKQSQVSGIGTKSQQALQLQREENKLERKVISRQMKEAEKEKQFELKQQKRKEKHRGR
ncbi:MAG: YjdF family protein [Eubacteriales bacterium]|nr:YjdF family protein [Eubacteriales bacterium]